MRDVRPKNVSGSYERLFNNAEIGALASKVQAAVIRSGTELEKMIASLVPNIPDLDAFLGQEIMPDGVFLATKRQIKKSKTLDFAGSEPDFMVFKRRKKAQTCHIVELKDGHVFDTKKASAERTAMHRFIERNAQHIQYRFQSHFVAFNQEDRNVIWEGFKKKIAFDEAMTGRQFCALLEIDYDAIVKARQGEGGYGDRSGGGGGARRAPSPRADSRRTCGTSRRRIPRSPPQSNVMGLLVERKSVRRVRDALARSGYKGDVIALAETARTAAEAARALGVAEGAIVKSLVGTSKNAPFSGVVDLESG